MHMDNTCSVYKQDIDAPFTCAVMCLPVIPDGHMERTVECLLSMNMPQTGGDRTAAAAAAAAAAASGAQAAPARPARGPAPQAMRANVGLDISRPLPDDFLRPPSYFKVCSHRI